MNRLAFEYYQKNVDNEIEDVILLDTKTHSFDELTKISKNFPKAWYELANLTLSDRIEFSSDFWLKTLPYIPHVYQLVYDFFLNLEDISVALTKKKNIEKFEVELVYSMKNESTFFRGKPPMADEEIGLINHKFLDMLPRDYLKFLKIHNGFAKNSDSGIIEAENIFDISNQMRDLIKNQNKTIHSNRDIIDPKDLIFFYQSYQQMDFQCFYKNWYPISEMGNVYYSYVDSSISDYKNSSFENLSFASFLDWLMFYLEVMDYE